MRRADGMLSLELTNALSAIGVFACVAVSGVHGFVQDLRRCDVVNPLLAGLRLARQAADDHAVTVAVCPSADGRLCLESLDWSAGWLAFVDRDGDGRLGAAEHRGVIARARNDASGIRVRSERAYFQFRGATPAAPGAHTAGTLAVCDPRGGGASRVITVGSRGRAVRAEYSPRVHGEVCP